MGLPMGLEDNFTEKVLGRHPQKVVAAFPATVSAL